MKKFLFAALLLLSAASTFAQQEVGSWSVIPRIGITASLIDGNDVSDDSETRTGFGLGAEMEYQFAPKVSLTFGAFYSQEGVVEREAFNGMVLKGTTKLDYINVPVMVNWYVARNFALKIGLQPCFNVSAKLKVDNIQVDGDAKGAILSIPFGLSYEFKNFVIDYRAHMGLSNVFDGVDGKGFTGMLTLGYRIPLKK